VQNNLYDNILYCLNQNTVHSSVQQHNKNCYVYCAHNNLYCIGAIVSAISIRKHNKKNDIFILLNENVGDDLKSVINNLNIRFKIIKNEDIKKVTSSYYTYSLLKLHAYNLLEYEKVIFLDSDTLVYKDISKYFNIEITAEQIFGDSDYLQRLIINNSRLLASSMFMIRPSIEMYDKIVDFNEKNRQNADMDLIHRVYPDKDKIIKTIHMYSNWYYEWIGIPVEAFKNLEIIHYNGTKPWDFYFNNNHTDITEKSLFLYNDWTETLHSIYCNI